MFDSAREVLKSSHTAEKIAWPFREQVQSVHVYILASTHQDEHYTQSKEAKK